ncbi:hypothetical protein KY285_009088 [Solanum tuberosum]|nr:hypothetical protein KY289_009565 [Solanum tuberosum]KAH0747431.1 hypothetical protein KY285_009088 [Solanum tuberosum]
MKVDLFDLNVSEEKYKGVKREILETLDGSFVDSYNKLEGYAIELRSFNLGSDIVIDLFKEALSTGKRKFLRMYICFKAMKLGFKSGLKPFIGLAGTFIEGKTKGKILVVVGQDRLFDAVRTLLPEAHQSYCARHIEANWCKRWGKCELKKFLWWVAWSSFSEEFEDQLQEIKEVDEEDGQDLVLSQNMVQSCHDSGIHPRCNMTYRTSRGHIQAT